MGLRGRKAKTAEEHIKDGTAAKKVLDERHASQQMEWRPPVKPSLDKFASEVWDRVVVELINDRLVSLYDQDVLTEYCETMANYARLKNKIGDREYTMNSAGKYTPHPMLKSLQRVEKRIKDLRDTLGLTPKARKAMNIVLKAPKGEDAKKKASILTKRS